MLWLCLWTVFHLNIFEHHGGDQSAMAQTWMAFDWPAGPRDDRLSSAAPRVILHWDPVPGSENDRGPRTDDTFAVPRHSAPLPRTPSGEVGMVSRRCLGVESHHLLLIVQSNDSRGRVLFY